MLLQCIYLLSMYAVCIELQMVNKGDIPNSISSLCSIVFHNIHGMVFWPYNNLMYSSIHSFHLYSWVFGWFSFVFSLPLHSPPPHFHPPPPPLLYLLLLFFLLLSILPPLLPPLLSPHSPPPFLRLPFNFNECINVVILLFM